MAGAGVPEKEQLIDAVSSSLMEALAGCCWITGGATKKKTLTSLALLKKKSVSHLKTYRSPPNWPGQIRCGQSFRPGICKAQRPHLERD